MASAEWWEQTYLLGGLGGGAGRMICGFGFTGRPLLPPF